MFSKKITIIFLFYSTILFGENYFVKTCYIYSKADSNSKKVCQKNFGDIVNKYSRFNEDFYKIKTEDCSGYVLLNCLSLKKNNPKRQISSIRNFNNSKIRFGPNFSIDGSWSKVYKSFDNKGLGYSGGLIFIIQALKKLTIDFSLSYRILSLESTFGKEGILESPSSLTINQTITYAGIGTILKYLIYRSFDYFSSKSEPNWYLKAGMEFLYPLSSKQSSSTGESFYFSNNEKLLFAILGASLEFPLTRRFGTLLDLTLCYNVFSKGESQMIGMRFSAAFLLGL